MNDEDLAAAYRARMGNGVPVDAPDPEAIQRVASGQAGEQERLAVLDIVMQSRALQREYDVFRALAAAAQPPRQRLPRSWLALAASLLLVVMAGSLWWRKDGAAPEAWRGPHAGLRLLTPASGARVAHPQVLRWSAVAGAIAYDVEVLGAGGAVAFAATVADTTAALPDSIPLGARDAWVWQVTARLRNGEMRRSAPASFSGAP